MTDGELHESLGFHIQRIVARDGTEFRLAPGQLVIVIGPNNSGKSTLLAELHASLHGESLLFGDGRILARVEYSATGSSAALRDWVDPQNVKSAIHQRIQSDKAVLVGPGGEIDDSDFSSWAKRRPSPRTVKQLVSTITYETRMQATKPAEVVDLLIGQPEHPIHWFVRLPSVAARVNDLVSTAFRLSLAADHGAGKHINIHCIPPESIPPSQNTVSTEYLRWLRSYPRLDAQGDGLRSYVGCLFEFLSRRSFITFIDEPEVFLHPPQARLLARTLATEKPASSQLIVATHSPDFLRGAIESNSDDVSIIRLNRHGNDVTLTSLDRQRLRELWSDPSLRHSNILDALFHSSAIVCEADADCRFYQYLNEQTGGPGVDNVMFVPSGGKTRIATILRALRALTLPCAVIADIDLLRDRHELEAIAVAAGGDWNEIKDHWRTLNESVSLRAGTPTLDQFRSRISDILRVSDKYLTDAICDKVRSAAKIDSGWSSIKRAGFSGFASGKETSAASFIANWLEARRVFIVPVGELEGFSRDFAGKGSGWVSQVLDRHGADSTELADARTFVRRVSASLATDSASDLRPSIHRANPNPRVVFGELFNALVDFTKRTISTTFAFTVVLLLGVYIGFSADNYTSNPLSSPKAPASSSGQADNPPSTIHLRTSTTSTRATPR